MRIKFLSYNIHKGFDLFGRWTLEDMRNALRSTSVDALLLQEVVGENKSLIKKFTKARANEKQFEFLADEVWPHFSYGKNAVFPSKHHGNAILSQYPIVESQNTDITTNNFEYRGLLYARIEYAGKKNLHICTTHLNLLSGGRRLQIEKIIKWVEQNIPADEPFVLAGDFNDWPGEISTVLSRKLFLQEAFKVQFGRYARSFPSLSPFLTLDRFYFRNLKICSAEILSGSPWYSLSDHLPLFVEVEVKSD